MQKPRISAIVALNKNRAIGRKNELIWRIPEDLRRFKALTTGHAIVMGRKTFESIGRALPDRKNIVITRDKSLPSAGSLVFAHSIDEAIGEARKTDPEEIFIIGGGEIYKNALGVTDRLYITLVESDLEGDVFFPDYGDFKKVIGKEKKEWNGLKYEWITLER